MSWFTDKVGRMVIVQTPIALRFSDSNEQATFECQIKKLNSLFHVTSINPEDYMEEGFVPKNQVGAAFAGTGFWAILHKGRLPRKDLVKEAVKQCLGCK